MSKPAIASASASRRKPTSRGQRLLPSRVETLAPRRGRLALLSPRHILRPASRHLRHRAADADRPRARRRRRSREPVDLQPGAGGDGPRPAHLAPVPDLCLEGAARRFRHVDPDRPAGAGRYPPGVSRHRRAGHRRHHHRHRLRHSARRLVGGLSQQPARPGHAGPRPHRIFGADLLARHHGAARLLSEAGMGRRARPPRRLSRRPGARP